MSDAGTPVKFLLLPNDAKAAQAVLVAHAKASVEYEAEEQESDLIAPRRSGDDDQPGYSHHA